MKHNFNDSNKQFIIVIIFIIFISISVYFLVVSDSGIKSDSKKSNLSNVVTSNSNREISNKNSNKVSNNNVKGSKPVNIVTSNKSKTSNNSGDSSSKNNNSGISYFTTEVSTNKIYVGDTTNIKVNIVPSTVKTKITYSSSNIYVARVSSSGIITGISPGVCNINISVEGGGESSFQIQILKNPTTTSNNNSKSNVVSNMISSVKSNQVITSNRPSNIINNRPSNGSKIAVQGISITNSPQTMTVGETVRLNAVITPSNATNKGITWKSSNPSVATVDSNGVVTAKAQGTALIVATTVDGAKRANAGITVKAKKTFTATFKSNGASSISRTISCTTSRGSDSCTITTPTITRSGYSIVGWGTSSNSTTAAVGVNKSLTLNGNKTYYAITKKQLTASFVNGSKTTKKSCYIYNTKSTCSVTVPYYDDKNGKYGGTWSTSKTGYTQAVGNNTININGNKTYYAVYRHPWRGTADIGGSNYKKDRNLSIQKAYDLGPTKVVYEKGIPQNAMITHYNFLVSLYYKMPYLFSPGKIWVMTEKTYSKYSEYYGLTHTYGPFFNIDLKYDTANKFISQGATIHELGHGWDFRFSFMHSSKKSVSAQQDIKNFYNSLGAKGRNNLSDVEWFAATVTDYYYRYVNVDKSVTTNSGYDKYSASNKKKMKSLIDKYIKISKNGYK